MAEKKVMVNLTITKASLEVLDALAIGLPSKDGLPLSRGEVVDWLAEAGRKGINQIATSLVKQEEN